MNEQTGVLSSTTATRDLPRLLREYLSALGWALLLALIIRTLLVQSFVIPSSSMEDTLLIGDYLLADKLGYGLRNPWSGKRLAPLRPPRRGDVVIFYPPEEVSSECFVKRLVGLPGDEIELRDKRLLVNGEVYDEPHASNRDAMTFPAGANPRDNYGPVRVPAGCYFMMGDNRDHSLDSRFWGFVPQERIVGRALLKYWSKVPNAWTVRWENVGRRVE
jgi:signal peptidase I